VAVSDLLLNILSRSDKRGLTEAADELDKLGRKADTAGEKLGGMAKESGHVDRQIEMTRTKVKELGEEFDRTGSKELMPQLRRERGHLAALEKIKKDFGDAGADSGRSFSARLGETFSNIAPGFLTGGLKAVVASPELGAIGAAAAVPIAAGLASALSGAALAGTAGAGIAAGIVLASSSPAVRGAWSTFGHDALDELQSAAVSFEEPLIWAARMFGDAISRDMPAIRHDFEILSPLVDDLATGAAGFVHNLQPGLTDAFKGAVPVIREISAALPRLGDDASFFFSELGGAGKAGADALGLTVDVLGASVRGLGVVLNQAGTAFELFGGGALAAAGKAGLLDKAVGFLANNGYVSLFNMLRGGKQPTDDFSQSLEDLNQRMDDAAPQAAFAEGMQSAEQSLREGAQAAQAMEQQLSDLARQMLNGKDAELAAKQGHLDMIDTLKASKGSLDDTTEAGIRSQQALVGQAQKALAVRDSVLAQTGSMEAADKAYDGLIAQIYADAKANHVSKEAVDGVIGSLQSIPKPNPVDIQLRRQGYTDDDLREYKRSLLGATGTYTATVNTVRNTYYNSITRSFNEALPGPFAHGLAKGGLRKAQVGMFIPPSDPGTVLTGEPQTGGEWLIPAQGISTSRAQMLGSAALGNYGLDVVPRSASYASPAMGGGGRATVVHEHRVVIQEPSGRRLAELVISDGRNGGPINAYIQQAASR
jgi:hypothetical protein